MVLVCSAGTPQCLLIREPVVKIKTKCPRISHHKREGGTIEPPSRFSMQEKGEENKKCLYKCNFEGVLGKQKKKHRERVWEDLGTVKEDGFQVMGKIHEIKKI